MATWVLVHSPLVGPESWAAVAAVLQSRGHRALVPDLRPTLAGGPGYADRQAEAVAAVVPPGTARLAAHSGAGPLLPAIADALAAGAVSAEAALFVDAGLPTPGRTRRSTLPDELSAALDAMTVDGLLPPWPAWWPEDELAAALPDTRVRSRFVDSALPIPAALFDDPLPTVADDVLAGPAYLQLSDAYAADAAAAEQRGWPVQRLVADHLAVLTRPEEVAAALLQLAG